MSNDLERKIKKQKELNAEAIVMIVMVDRDFKNVSNVGYSIDDAFRDAREQISISTDLKLSADLYIKWIFEKACVIRDILESFNSETFRKIRALIK